MDQRGHTFLSEVWRALEQLPSVKGLFNEPAQVLLRVLLLQKLAQLSINDFKVYPLLAGKIPRPERFPVFYHEANDHQGALTKLIPDQPSLERLVHWLEANHKLTASPIITEFVDVSVNGRFRKYGVYRIGSHIVPAHIIESNHWMVKLGDPDQTEALEQEELEYVQTNPHEKELMQIFKLASIDYGRIDYGFSQGRIQVFEINTNPTLLAPGFGTSVRQIPRRKVLAQNLNQAFAALDRP